MTVSLFQERWRTWLKLNRMWGQLSTEDQDTVLAQVDEWRREKYGTDSLLEIEFGRLCAFLKRVVASDKEKMDDGTN